MDVNNVGAKRFSAAEEEALQRDEATSSIVKRTGNTNVEVYGTDRSWKATKEHQLGLADNGWSLGAGVVHAATDGAEIAGLVHLGAAGVIGGAALGLFLGLRELGEAQKKSDEQARAIAKDNAHAALIAVLDLPESYQASRLDADPKTGARGEYAHVAKEDRDRASQMTASLRADSKALATLQLHADRGMTAAKELAQSGMTAVAFLEKHPNVAESYRKDAAFREGFDAYLYAKANLPAAQVKEMETKLQERDGWYAMSHVSVRV